MDLLVAQLLNGISNGTIYAALALALVLVFRGTGITNYAQGEMALVSTYVAWQLHAWNLNVVLVIALTALFSFGFGALVQITIIERVDRDNTWGLVILTFGLFLILADLVGLIWNYDPLALDAFSWDVSAELGPVVITGSDLIAMIVLIGEVTFIWFLFRHTRMGLAMRASVSDRTAATLVGVSNRRMAVLSWGIAGILGSVAGMLAAQRLILEPGLMFGPLIYALAAMALGGLDSPGGAVIGSMVVGISESMGSTYIPFLAGDLSIAVPLGVIIVVLLLRPQGLFGSPKLVRV